MIYTMQELRQIVEPIAIKYGIPQVYVFGSYARNEAIENSDIDFLIVRTGSQIKGMFDMGSLYEDLQTRFNTKIDLLTAETLEQRGIKERSKWFIDTVNKEKVMVYEQQ